MHKAEEEIAILKKYLPEALSDDELKAIVAEVVAAVGATTMKDMGKDNAGCYGQNKRPCRW